MKISRLLLVILATISQTVNAQESVSLPDNFASQLKAVVIVGPTQESTAASIDRMHEVSSCLEKKGVEVKTFYDPDAHWNEIVSASAGAHIFIYSGHGTHLGGGSKVGGLVLSNDEFITSDQIRTDLKLHKNALIIFTTVCGAAGSSAIDVSDIGLTEAVQRVSDYAHPFIEIGAAGYYANNFLKSIVPFLEGFFSQDDFKSLYEESINFASKIETTQKYQYNPEYLILVSSSQMSGEGYKDYSIAMVGKPDFKITDLFKESPSGLESKPYQPATPAVQATPVTQITHPTQPTQTVQTTPAAVVPAQKYRIDPETLRTTTPPAKSTRPDVSARTTIRPEAPKPKPEPEYRKVQQKPTKIKTRNPQPKTSWLKMERFDRKRPTRFQYFMPFGFGDYTKNVGFGISNAGNSQNGKRLQFRHQLNVILLQDLSAKSTTGRFGSYLIPSYNFGLQARILDKFRISPRPYITVGWNPALYQHKANSTSSVIQELYLKNGAVNAGIDLDIWMTRSFGISISGEYTTYFCNMLETLYNPSDALFFKYYTLKLGLFF